MSNSRDVCIIFLSIFLDLGGEIRDFPDRLLEKYLSRSGESDESSRIIASIFEVAQSLDEEWNRIFLAIVGKYSAHRLEVVSGIVIGSWNISTYPFSQDREKSQKRHVRTVQ